MDSEGFFKTIMVIGLGLVGGSIVKALRLNGFSGVIIGVEQNPDNHKQSKQSGLLNEVYDTLSQVNIKPDLIILAVPLGAMRTVLIEVKPHLKKGTIITDVGSVKGTVHNLAKEVLTDLDASFIGGHPMAGSEKGGFSAATPIMFENAYYFLTPEKELSVQNIRPLEMMILSFGAIPVITTPERHDALTARLSHLPHLAASLLVNVFSRNHPLEDLQYAGGGFRDTTRVAMGSSELWRDIFFHNKQQLISAIESFSEELDHFKNHLLTQDTENVVSSFEKAKRVRSELTMRRPSEEASLYPLVLDVEDKTGILADITGLLAKAHINIKDIAIDHARENKPGALILSFSSIDERAKAAHKIQVAGLCPVSIEQD